MSDSKKVAHDEKLIEYTKDNAHKFPEDFRLEIDDALIARTGADSKIAWELGGKIFLRQTNITEDEMMLELACAEINSGYNAENHLYAIDGRIYVEDDYVWCDLGKDSHQGVSATECTNLVYSDDEEEHDDEEPDVGTENDSLYSSIKDLVDMCNRDEVFWVNYYDNQTKQSDMVKFEPLVVNNFDLENPLLKVEKAYRDALCEIESYPSCGWIILLHDGHFYVPVESIEDPVNHDIFYYVKIFNSYPVAITSGRMAVTVYAEIFNSSYSIGIRYRPGYCINWRQFFFEYFLSGDYLDQIPDFYKVTDKPYGSPERQNHFSDYDGFKYHSQDDDEDDT